MRFPFWEVFGQSDWMRGWDYVLPPAFQHVHRLVYGLDVFPDSAAIAEAELECRNHLHEEGESCPYEADEGDEGDEDDAEPRVPSGGAISEVDIITHREFRWANLDSPIDWDADHTGQQIDNPPIAIQADAFTYAAQQTRRYHELVPNAPEVVTWRDALLLMEQWGLIIHHPDISAWSIPREPSDVLAVLDLPDAAISEIKMSRDLCDGESVWMHLRQTMQDQGCLNTLTVTINGLAADTGADHATVRAGLRASKGIIGFDISVDIDAARPDDPITVCVDWGEIVAHRVAKEIEFATDMASGTE